MSIRISLEDKGQTSELESLSDWLRREPRLSGRVSVTGPVPDATELGALVDAVVVAVGSGGMLSVLATSLSSWLSLPRKSSVRIRIQGEANRSVEIDADRVDAERIEALVREALGSEFQEE